VASDLVGNVTRDSIDDMVGNEVGDVGPIDDMVSKEVDEQSLNAIRHAFIKCKAIGILSIVKSLVKFYYAPFI